MRRVLMLVPLVGVLVFGVMLNAQANHPPTSDAGVDVAWVNDMNSETYWETLWNAECTKYEGHGGQIPANIDGAVVKSGSSFVHVYSDLTNTGAFTAIGPPNPNDQHPNRRHAAPFSWVIKCQNNATTTTIPEETTTSSTSSTTLPPSTTTTVVDTTTSTTASGGSSSTTLPAPTTTVDTTETWFDATSACQSDGSFTLSVEFGEGMESAYVSLLDPMFPDPVAGDGVTLTPDNPTTRGTLGASGAFEVTGTPLPGYEIVGSNPIVVLIDNCPEPSVAPSSSVPVDPQSPPTLPFTGIEDTFGLAFAALGLVGMGWLMLRGRRA